MFRSTVFKKSVAGVLAVSVFAMIACDKHGGVDGAVPESEPVADVVDQSGATTAYAYLPGNPFHDGKIEELLGRPDVSAVVDGLAERGLSVSRDKSMTLRGVNGENTIWVTFIALDGPGRSAMIACYGSGDRFGIAPAEFALDRPVDETGWQPFIGNGWYAVPSTGLAPRSPQKWQPTEWWDWDFFAACMLNRAPEASAMCGIQCTLVPGYWHCYLVCTVAEAVGAAITCILNMYTWGGNKWDKN